MSKLERHSAIRDLVAGAPVSNQDELRRRLVRRGFDVTQATLSRDINELQLFKGPHGYALANPTEDTEDDDSPSVLEMMRSFARRVKQAQNLLVVTTSMGGAQPVAAAIDQEEMPEVVGTIAGDDTVLLICPDLRQASQLRERLTRMIG